VKADSQYFLPHSLRANCAKFIRVKFTAQKNRAELGYAKILCGQANIETYYSENYKMSTPAVPKYETLDARF